ncbi:MAG TPA: protein kinase [Acidobacteriota bacterium]|nr:protein kinase [Acidobacteriota bacterium]HQM64349.1 protein kinase [Acidobacteriota bacterium]
MSLMFDPRDPSIPVSAGYCVVCGECLPGPDSESCPSCGAAIRPSPGDGADPADGHPAVPPSSRSAASTTAEMGPEGFTPRQLPEHVGPYDIQAELGRGGMGVVYRAWQPSLKRTVALKVMLAGEFAGEHAVRRFIREAEAAARLRHPHIVSILDLGEQDGKPYFTMAYIEGQTLEQAIRAHAVSLADGVAIVAKVAGAVAHAHANGVIHRDLKPANILLDGGGEPHVTDFGLAAQAREASSITGTGAVLGTPLYMAPEQVAGARHLVDERTDVYSLGATLYHVLTGCSPFPEEAAAPVLFSVLTREPKPPRAIRPDIPRDLELICLTAMAKERDRRYASMNDFRDDLERCQRGEAIRARPASLFYRLGKRLRRNRAVTVLSVLLVAVLTAAAGWTWFQQARTWFGWEEVFRDEFARTGLGPDYRPDAGAWSVADGELRGSGTGYVDISLVRPFAGNVRLAFDARVLPGSPKREIAVFLDGPDEDRSGYYFGFGGDYATTAIDRAGLEVRLARSPAVEAGRRYEMVVTRKGNRVEIAADGEVLADYLDPFPLDPSAMTRLRFGTYDGGLAVDNLRVYQESVPEMLTATAVGDRLFERGQLAAARQEYEHIARDHAGKAIAGEALFKAGLCRLLEGDYAAARVAFEGVDRTPADELYRNLAVLNTGAALRLQGRYEDAFRHLTDLERRSTDSNERYRLAGELQALSHAAWTHGQAEMAFRHLRFIIDRFPGTEMAERSEMVLAANDPDETTRRRRLERFLARHPRPSKNQNNAFQLLAGSCLLLGDPAGALAALDRHIAAYRGINTRFVLGGLLGKGLVLAALNRWIEAGAVRDEMLALLPGDPLPARQVRELDVFIARRQGEPDRAVRILETAAADGAIHPAEELTLALLYRERGEAARADALWRRVAAGPPSEESKAAALFLGDRSPDAFRSDESVLYPYRCLYLWQYHRLRGEPDDALTLEYARQSAPFIPEVCEAILALRPPGGR